MEQAIRTPSEIHSFNLDESIFDLNKKRKLQADQLGLPISKHNCWNHRTSPKPLDISENNRLVSDLTAGLANNETEPVESAKDSNSFIGENDCSMSESSDSKFESDGSKLWSSTATSNVTTAENEPVYEVEDYDPTNYFDEIQVYQNLDAGNLEVDGVDECFGHGIVRLKPFKSLNEANPDDTLLSTGSCSVNQDAESVRKPTIDQEFEQYFSMLML